jgi:hypothetical protein
MQCGLLYLWIRIIAIVASAIAPIASNFDRGASIEFQQGDAPSIQPPDHDCDIRNF